MVERVVTTRREYNVRTRSNEQLEADTQTGRIIAEVGNALHYPIVLTVIQDKTRTINTVELLHRNLINLQAGSTNRWDISQHTVRSIVDKLRSSEFVRIEKLSQTRSEPYIVPQERNQDVNMALLIMDHCYQNGVNPARLFGRKQSKSVDEQNEAVRASSLRLAIFRELVLSGSPVSVADLMHATKASRERIKAALQELSRDNMHILEYRSLDTGEPLTTYSLPEEIPPGIPSPYNGKIGPTAKVYQVVKDLIAQGMTPTIRQVNDEYVARGGTDNENTTGPILAHIAAQGFITQTKEPYSEAFLTEDQRIFLAELLWIIDLHKSDSELLTRAQSISQRILTDPLYTGGIMERAHPPLPNFQVLIPQILADDMVMTSYPNGITARELYDIITNMNSEWEFALGTVRTTVAELVASGIVQYERISAGRRIETRYQIIPTSPAE